MSEESSSLSPADIAKAADRKIVKEISLAIGGMMIVALAIYFVANSIAG